MNYGIEVHVDLKAVLANARRIRSLIGPSAPAGRMIYAVVKADAYGLGARNVARALKQYPGLIDGFYAFDLNEAVAAGLTELGLPIIALDQPWRGHRPADYANAKVRPVVMSAARAAEMRAARISAALSIDTGMRRFGCEPAEAAEAIRVGGITEVMTHAVRLRQVERLLEIAGGAGRRLHAAGSTLLEEPKAWLDGVRPGAALYRGAMRVSARVVEARDVRGAGGRAGYGQFPAERVGVILAGYSNGIKPGACLIRGEPRRIYEVGMQTAFVELRSNEDTGEEVILLGEGLTEGEVAAEWGISEQEVMVRLGANRKDALRPV